MSPENHFDMVVIGSGPAGQKAAIQGSKANKKVLVIEKETAVGGHCVHYGTIPSKTLRETTVALEGFRTRAAGAFDLSIPEGTKVTSLMTRLQQVVRGHEEYIGDQLERNGIEVRKGRARFVSDHKIEVQSVSRTQNSLVYGEVIIVATGSSPRRPDNVPIDHEHILDSDSLLSLNYLPRSLTVLGAGVIASEYASIFASLGTKVTMIDNRDRPVGFLDSDLTDRFEAAFRRKGGLYLPKEKIESVEFDGMMTKTYLGGGKVIESEKLLCALGRLANIRGLNLEGIGIEPTSRGLLPVDENLRTSIPHIYGVGDVIGPPSLASSAMEQGRRAACHALGLPTPGNLDTIPSGIYTIPEMSSVGLTEAQAIEKYGDAVVGRAKFEEIARGHVSGVTDGLLKLVSDPEGRRVLGIHIVGESATELIHVGQMAILTKADISVFIDNTFNFPTFAECYRVAALDVVGQVEERREADRQMRKAG